VAINAAGLYVIDPVNVVILLGLKHEELSWDYAKPSQENNEDCLPCLFIQGRDSPICKNYSQLGFLTRFLTE
jgi:hypothetical protein